MSVTADSPYPGSRAFRQDDQEQFFGRSREAADVADYWTANRITIVTGPPGAGKTSLLHAGVYRLMAANGLRSLPPGSLSAGLWYPYAALPEHDPFTRAVLGSWAPARPARLAGQSVSDFTRRLTPGRDGAIYAAIDHLDDLLEVPMDSLFDAWRTTFLAGLRQALSDHPRLHLLLVARPEARALLTGAVGGGIQYELKALTVQGAAEAIMRPAVNSGRTVTGEAAWRLADALRTTRVLADGDVYHDIADRVEPSLVQALARRLWDTWPGGVAEITPGAAASLADEALTARCVTAAGQVADDLAAAGDDITPWRVAAWLAGRFTGGDATCPTVPEGMVSTEGLPNEVALGLVGQHILTRQPCGKGHVYQLLSPRLIEPVKALAATFPESLATSQVGDWGPDGGGRQASRTAISLHAAERDLARGDSGLARKRAAGVAKRSADPRERAQATSLLANLAYWQGGPAYRKAVSLYREAATLIQSVGDTAGAARQLAAAGQSLLAMNEPREALPDLRAAVERAPSDPVLQTKLAIALWQLGEGWAAVATLNGVLATDGGNLEALRARGEILADLGDAATAILDLNREAVSDRPSTRAARGLALAELGDFSAATRDITAAVDQAQRSGPVLLFSARASELTGDREASRTWARRAKDATEPALSDSQQAAAARLVRRLTDADRA